MPKLAYRPQEAADQLGVTRQTIYAWMASGRLESVKIGRARLIRHDDLVAMLDDASSVAA